MQRIQEIIAEAVRQGLTSPLTDAGWKRRGNSFYSDGDDCVKILNVQSNRHNTSIEGSFTLNLGVHFPALHRLAELVPFTGFPKEYDCEVRTRIGKLMPARSDYWWAVNMKTDPKQLGYELTGVWKEFAVDWLERHSKLPNAATELEAQRLYRLAAAAHLLLGNRERATELVVRELQDFPRAANNARRWALKHDLAV